MRRVFVFLILTLAGWAQESHPILALGSSAPNFELPGVDGATHKLADYSSSPVLVVVFTCNHCPIAQMYERRIAQLAADYHERGVAVVAIQPNDPTAIRIDELDSSDISDSLEEMKIRAEYKHLTYPYLYDGQTQSVAQAYGPQATPHVFVFDRERRLRYEGRMDNSYRAELVKTHEVRDAVDALLANQEVAVKHTGVFGCSTKWREKQAARLEAIRKIESQPVPLEMASATDLKALRANRHGQDLTGQLLGDMVRLVHPRVSRFRGYVPNVWCTRSGVGNGGRQYAGRKEQRFTSVAEDARHQSKPAV